MHPNISKHIQITLHTRKKLLLGHLFSLKTNTLRIGLAIFVLNNLQLTVIEFLQLLHD